MLMLNICSIQSLYIIILTVPLSSGFDSEDLCMCVTIRTCRLPRDPAQEKAKPVLMQR